MNELRAIKNWDWFEAIYLYDVGSPESLSRLIINEEIPTLLRQDIADRLNGTIKPNKNSIGQFKTTPTTRLKVLIETCELMNNIDLKANEYLLNLSDSNYFESDYFESDVADRVKKDKNIVLERQAVKLKIKQKGMKYAFDSFLERLNGWPYSIAIFTQKNDL